MHVKRIQNLVILTFLYDILDEPMVYMIDGEKVVLIGKHCLGKVLSFIYFLGIWCTFWFIAGSRIIENNLRGCFFLFLGPAVGL